MSAFWKYFADTLRWPQLFAPGPLQALTRGLAGHLDATRDDALYLREQFFPAKAEASILPGHGDARGITRHPKEGDAQFRQRVVHAWRWHMLGGKTLGLPEILKFYGFDALHIDSLRQWVPSRWAEFQVGLKTPTTQAEQTAILEQLEMLVWLINEYKPARSVLARIYTDTYDWYPTIWSEGPVWSDGFWSKFSGVEIPGFGELPGCIVSFGMPYRVSAEQYNVTGAGLGAESRQGALIPYIDRPIWSRSAWSTLYPVNSCFTVGELVSIHWCENIVFSYPWSGDWDGRHWAELSTWDRILPPWSFAQHSWCKAQAVHSWPGASVLEGQDGAYGDINACYSMPEVVLTGMPPRWGAFAYSEDDPHRRVLRIQEQFWRAARLVSLPLNPRIKGHGASVKAQRGFLAPYLDHAVWSRSPWSESYPQGHGFTGAALGRWHFCDRLLVSQGWTGQWDHRHWAETAGWDRILPPWSLADLSWCKAQAVHSWPGTDVPEGQDGAYGDINACYSVPEVVLTGTPPRWGAFAYSEDDPHRRVLRIQEQFWRAARLVSLPLVPRIDQHGVGIKARRGFLAPYLDHAVWSRSPWSESYPQGHGFTGAALARFRYDERLSQGCFSQLSWCRAQAVHSEPTAKPVQGKDGTYGDINACYSVPEVVTSGVPPRWGTFAYSEDDPQRQECQIPERWQDTRTLGIEAVSPLAPGIVIRGDYGTGTAEKHDQTWQGTWDQRRWWNYYAQSNIIRE